MTSDIVKSTALTALIPLMMRGRICHDRSFEEHLAEDGNIGILSSHVVQFVSVLPVPGEVVPVYPPVVSVK